ANEHWNSPAHGTVGLPSGSEAGLWRRPRRLETILHKAGAGPGAARLSTSIAFKGGPIELEQLCSADPPLAVDCLHSGRHRQRCRHAAGETSRLGRPAGAIPADLDAAHGPVLVRAAPCRQMAQRLTHERMRMSGATTA